MYQYKEKYILDFSDVEYYLQMHFIIREAFDWPTFYGCNWDAFWDCITEMYGEPVHIEIRGLDVIERKFDDTAKMLIDILKRFKHNYDDEYADDIQIEIVDGDTRISLN